MDGTETTTDPAPDWRVRSSALPRALIVASVVAGLAAIAALVVGPLLMDDGDETATETATANIAAFDEMPLTLTDGTETTLRAWEGQPLVVNFWATWCAPCQAEMPELQAAADAADGRYQVIGINHDIDEASWLNFVATRNITFPTAFQPDQGIFEALNLFAMPSTLFVAPDGEIVHTFTGVVTTDSLDEMLDEYLGIEARP
ncbi:MAG: TlpA family protein disulfide reductase [Acidimicrobiales bacterium]